jgi:hypothetical protein
MKRKNERPVGKVFLANVSLHRNSPNLLGSYRKRSS